MSWLKTNLLVIGIALILSIIPFFWLKPGEIDLGGDSSRLYFYDPASYILHDILSPVSGNGVGKIQYVNYSQLPYVMLLFVLNKILSSSYLLIILSNSLKLSVGFLAMYAIVKEFVRSGSNSVSSKVIEASSILGGLFYILSRHMVANYDVALIHHNQVFLNPLVFYLLLKYLLTTNVRYIWVTLLLTILFAPNFAYPGSPVFFSFYPLSLLFLLLYVVLIRKKEIPVKGILLSLILFISLHAYQLVPTAVDILYPESHVYASLFDAEGLKVQRDSFYGMVGIAKLALNIFLPSWTSSLTFFSLITPFIITFGFILNKTREKAIVLTGIFFLLAFFLLTAKVTNVGIHIYSFLFYIPGFSMFRNFTGVWAYVYSFFYGLLLGLTVAIIFSRLSLVKIKMFSILGGVLIVLSSWPLISGDIAKRVLTLSNNVRPAFTMDPRYEEMFTFVRDLPTDGKIISFPFTDCCYEVIYGRSGGAYSGPSIIGYLSGKNVFSGYNHMPPFSDTFWELAKAQDFESIKKLFGLFSIQYIYHNSDPRVYDSTFPDYPYSNDYVRKYLPKDQKEYNEFVKKLTVGKVFETGLYGIYLVDPKYFLPHFYIPKEVVLYQDDVKLSEYGRAKSFFPSKMIDEERMIFIEEQACNLISLEKVCEGSFQHTPKIQFERINKTKYKIKVSEAKEPFVLVFSDLYHGHWRLFDTKRESEGVFAKGERIIANVGKTMLGLFRKEPSKSSVPHKTYFDSDISEGIHTNLFFTPSMFDTWGKKVIADDRHFQVNGYANAWYIMPDDMGGRQDFELIAEVWGPKVFYATLPVSLLALMGFLLWGARLFFKTWYNREP